MNAPPAPSRKSRLEEVREHTAKTPPPPLGDPSARPTITKFGSVTIASDGVVQVRDFSTQNTPEPGDLPRLVIDWAIDRLLGARGLFTPAPMGLEKYTDAIAHSLRSQNWFGALFLALAMPDICGALETPNEQVGPRYRTWFDKYVAKHYAPQLFSASDCYYLRCAALHQGLAEHPKSQSKQVVFITPPPPGIIFHSNFIESPDGSFVLQLQIDVFCQQVCAGVRSWHADVQSDREVQSRIAELLEFQDPTKPFKSKA